MAYKILVIVFLELPWLKLKLVYYSIWFITTNFFLIFQVGILDVDLCGPSVPYLLKLENQEVHQCAAGWVPVYTDESKSLGVLSIGFLTKSRNDSVVWRGPKKTGF